MFSLRAIVEHQFNHAADDLYGLGEVWSERTFWYDSGYWNGIDGDAYSLNAFLFGASLESDPRNWWQFALQPGVTDA